MSDEEDCWDAFGSSSDEDEDSDAGNGGGSDEENNGINVSTDETGIDTKGASSIAMHLSQTFLKHNSQVKLSDRTVAVVRVVAAATDVGGNNNDIQIQIDNCECTLSKQLEQRQMKIVRLTIWSEKIQQGPEKSLSQFLGTLDRMVDALIILDDASNLITNETKIADDGIWIQELVESILCPGGVLIVSKSENGETTNRYEDFLTKQLVGSDDSTILQGSKHPWIVRHKKTIRAHASTCPWLSSSHSVEREEERLQLATVALSSHEMASSPVPSETTPTRRSSKLTEHSVRKAVHNMKEYGYCILPGLLDTSECLEWSSAVLDCVHGASKILLERDGVNIYNPQASTREPQSYREMSMREDLRMDLRHGPALSKLRAKKEGSAATGGKSIVVSAAEDHHGDGHFLRGHTSLLEVIRRTMNPGSSSFEDANKNHSAKNSTKPLYVGNMGRWNFGGTGNNGAFQDLRISPIGGIVSLPGSAEQALHADTPHLFEHIPDLPAHYINVFAPCTAFDEAVGGTAFIHGSHNLAFTAQHYDADHNASFYPFLVRPRLSLGDVVLFDCRILHFGLANTSRSIERCICYVNTWHDWFHDAKNWNKNRAIFEQHHENESREEISEDLR